MSAPRRFSQKGWVKIRKRTLGILAIFLLLDALVCFCLFPDWTRERLPLPSPTETPAPTEPVVTPPPERWTVTDESAEEILALAALPSLREIDATQSREYAALLTLREQRPDCDIRWTYRLGGTGYPSDTRTLTAHSLKGLEDAIRYLPALESVDLRETEATLSDLERLDAVRPGIFYRWNFTLDGRELSTDLEVFSTRRDGVRHRYTDEELYPLLKYCRRLKALDLSHNALHDISPIAEMTELEILNLSDNYITDATPLGALTKLSHLELQMNRGIRDFSFLPKLIALRELNVCYDPYCTNLDFLASMPDFAFGMFKFTDVDSDDYTLWQEKRPDTILVYRSEDFNSDGDGWHEYPRNHAIRSLFARWDQFTEYPGV